MGNEKMIKVIMDCDPGHDDAIALLLASRADNIQILGVTTVQGNSELRYTSKNARRVLDYADVTDIDVYAGCPKPMMKEQYRQTGIAIHGEDGLGGPHIPDSITPIKEKHAVNFIIDTLRASDEKITLIPTGPLTNIATAFIMAPDIKDKIEKIVIMGGAVYTEGNVNTSNEFNLFLDPEAAKIVLNSGCDVYLNTLDVSMKAVFMKEDVETLRAQGDKISVIVAELLDFFGITHERLFNFYSIPIHDALCVGMLIDDTLIEYEHVWADISTKDELTAGEVVADIWHLTDKKPNCYIAKKVDREKFVKMVCEHMKKPYVSKYV
ncbi:nucleoside hydrolase [Clostridium aminobutyricum]|uniref:Nucleoside hydrolase n=1 Tax=Clostridium aminobutyricum TaxID=33953 RepID=A0A939D926_CLOAM|nr:nucleoside hydrolase [Clostridium aminobutyricum]MBN7773370.1 nucleoside hydrolase [Clostridium aminobutyricum]